MLLPALLAALSAFSFSFSSVRPAFTELLAFLKKNKRSAELLLFPKWDRFSRNAGDAYGMISQLTRLGIEPQAIEQPPRPPGAGMRRTMKEGRYEPEIRQLQQNLEGIGQLAQKLNDHIKAACELLRNLRLYYIAAALPVKQKLIGSMFPEKLVFEKKNYRTIELNPTVALICRPSAGLDEKRKGLTPNFGSQPCSVSPIGFEPMAH